MSDEEKRVFLETLWSILMQFVDLGFGIHPVQEPCGKVSKNPRNLPISTSDTVECGPTTMNKTKENDVACNMSAASEE